MSYLNHVHLAPTGTVLVGDCEGLAGSIGIQHFVAQAFLAHYAGHCTKAEACYSIKWAQFPQAWLPPYAYQEWEVPVASVMAQHKIRFDFAMPMDTGCHKPCGHWRATVLEKRAGERQGPGLDMWTRLGLATSKTPASSVSDLTWAPNGRQLAASHDLYVGSG